MLHGLIACAHSRGLAEASRSSFWVPCFLFQEPTFPALPTIPTWSTRDSRTTNCPRCRRHGMPRGLWSHSLSDCVFIKSSVHINTYSFAVPMEGLWKDCGMRSSAGHHRLISICMHGLC